MNSQDLALKDALKSAILFQHSATRNPKITPQDSSCTTSNYIVNSASCRSPLLLQHAQRAWHETSATKTLWTTAVVAMDAFKPRTRTKDIQLTMSSWVNHNHSPNWKLGWFFSTNAWGPEKMMKPSVRWILWKSCPEALSAPIVYYYTDHFNYLQSCMHNYLKLQKKGITNSLPCNTLQIAGDMNDEMIWNGRIERYHFPPQVARLLDSETKSPKLLPWPPCNANEVTQSGNVTKTH